MMFQSQRVMNWNLELNVEHACGTSLSRDEMDMKGLHVCIISMCMLFFTVPVLMHVLHAESTNYEYFTSYEDSYMKNTRHPALECRKCNSYR